MLKPFRHQKSIIIGTVLGDAYLQKTGKKNARLRLEHGIGQKQYLLWKAVQLGGFFQGKAKHLKRVHPKTEKTYEYVRHQSQSTPYFGALQRRFYSNGRKIIPRDIEKDLTQLALTVWYMDDGYYYARDKCAYLYLGNVSEEEAQVAAHALQKKFGLDPRAVKKKKGYALYFSPREAEKLKQTVKGFILPQFNYKLPS